MPIIYEPKGKAREYSALAANLYKGCSHACAYCFAPSATFTDRLVFSRETYIQPRPGVLSQLEKDCRKLTGNPEPILMSFTSDPYQPVEKKLKITRQALELMSAHSLRPQILTKSGTWGITRDADLLKKANGIWAATLTTEYNSLSKHWEPGAAMPSERIEALEIAKSHGLQTWISFEPVLYPVQVLSLIEKTHKFVDLYKVGKLNYHPLAEEIDWQNFLFTVEAQLDRFDCKRYIKKDLEAFRNAT